MSTFRCSAGHFADLTFGAEQVRHPCPACGIDVYKFRDAVHEDDVPAAAASNEVSARSRARLPLDVWHARAAVVGAVLISAGALFVLYRPAAVPPAPSSAPVIPIAPRPAPAAARGNPADVSISGFAATVTGAGTVKASFRLVNRKGAPNDYPALAVHWHGVPAADQLIRKNAYAHPPIPFTTTDVTLELAHPQGATGMDVEIVY
jgi:hypothetical protein